MTGAVLSSAQDVDLAALPGAVGASSLPAQLHEILEQAIISGVLKPGQRLHADHLAARYGVSRIPIREALRSLHASGWVDIRPRYGVYVRERSESELHALFEIRAVLEGQAASWAAQRRTKEDLATLRRVVKASRRAADSADDQTLAILDVQFYDALRAAAHNSVLDSTLGIMKKRARFYFATVASQLGRDWVEVHEHLVGMIADGDEEAAGSYLRQHIEDTGRAVGELLHQQGI